MKVTKRQLKRIISEARLVESREDLESITSLVEDLWDEVRMDANPAELGEDPEADEIRAQTAQFYLPQIELIMGKLHGLL